MGVVEREREKVGQREERDEIFIGPGSGEPCVQPE